MLEHFGRSPGTPFEVEELALQFSSSEAHLRRLVKRLWRQGHILEETRQVPIAGSKGGMTRKKVYLCDPIDDDQVLQTQSQQGQKALDRDLVQNGQVHQSQTGQGEKALDYPIRHTGAPSSGASMPLKVGDWVEILTGYFASRHVEVIGFPRDKPGWVNVKGKDWAITHQYQRSDLRLIRRTQV
ncbi:MAG: hypothetical protein HC851_22150 [Acaryochloris sp. RU_4_1]|nr:hypothetical protein [Acaryochloris sp. RU_4_1]